MWPLNSMVCSVGFLTLQITLDNLVENMTLQIPPLNMISSVIWYLMSLWQIFGGHFFVNKLKKYCHG